MNAADIRRVRVQARRRTRELVAIRRALATIETSQPTAPDANPPVPQPRSA